MLSVIYQVLKFSYKIFYISINVNQIILYSYFASCKEIVDNFLKHFIYSHVETNIFQIRKPWYEPLFRVCKNSSTKLEAVLIGSDHLTKTTHGFMVYLINQNSQWVIHSKIFSSHTYFVYNWVVVFMIYELLYLHIFWIEFDIYTHDV